MAADKEHIEGFAWHNTHHESKLVEQNSHTNGYREYRHTAQDGLVTRLDRSCVIQKYPHHDHGRMTYHTLYIDPNADRKNVFGINHHTRACKEGKGGKIIQQCALQLAARHSRQKPDVHGRGAKLPRKRIPLIIKLHTAVVRKAIIDELRRFMKDSRFNPDDYELHILSFDCENLANAIFEEAVDIMHGYLIHKGQLAINVCGHTGPGTIVVGMARRPRE